MELDLTGIIFRVSVMYLYALALLRISGKQSVGHLTALDFIVTLIIGDLFDDIFWAEVPILQGMVAFAAITLVHILVTYLASRNRSIHRLVVSPPRLVVEDGRLAQENLQRERLRPETVQNCDANTKLCVGREIRLVLRIVLFESIYEADYPGV